MNFALPIAFDRRLVLFPQGQLEDPVHRERCTQFVLWCGGDVGRVIDAPVPSVEIFSAYLRRIRGLTDGTEQMLIVLTCTNPLALTVVNLRRRLERRLPSLRRARWMIYLDSDADPFFQPMAERLGRLKGDPSGASIWIGPQDSPFLVMSSLLKKREAVCSALGELDASILAASVE